MGIKAVWAALGVLVIAVGAGLFLIFSPSPSADSAVACTMEAKICPDGTAVGRSGPQCEFAACPMPALVWSFKDAGTDEATGTPHTEVTLTMNGKAYPAGTYEGSCSEIASEHSSWELVAGEQSGVICWWAGGGTELGVFEENGQLVIKKGMLDEGGAETPGLRGNFELLLKLGA